ncbi:MAG: FAD:protein FMN transferase [Oenococcus sp.]|uniref:FAD:protein FMN transferase n=1 Tax=Oenococcus sp. TaxID=1979414 RepID=UPI0039E9CE60
MPLSTIHKTYYAIGTRISLSLFPPAEEADLAAAYDLICDYEDRLTVNRDHSELMSINQAAGQHPVAVSKISYDLIKRADAVSRLNLGFNAAIGPLVKLWQIGFSGANLPDPAEIKKRLSLIDPAQIQLDDDERTVFLKQAGMELDLGAIAKGYIADAVLTLWQQRGLKSGVIDLGGNILLMGKSQHPDGLWRVGIQDPALHRNQLLGSLETTSRSIVTSGIYERFLQVDGKKYHHMFDSKTGYPIANDLASVTIISPRSIDGDIWTTLAFYAGLKAGLAMIEKQPDLEAIFVTRDRQAAITNGLTQSFHLLNPDYQMIEP